MTRDEIRNAVIKALTSVAPEIESRVVDADTILRGELDLDSMDFLNFVIALHESLGVDVPETDYGKLGTINGAVQYLSSILNA